MSFLVRANSGKPGEGSFEVNKTTRKDAVETAVGLLGQGMTGVTITDDTGRVYLPAAFDEFFDEDGS